MNVLKTIFFGTYARGFVSSYLIFLMIGAAFLSLPISLKPDVSFSTLDALFTSASALSTTGLSTIVVRDTFSIFGQVILLMIIQIGGIGLIMMVALFWLIVGKKIGFKQRNMMVTDQNQLSRQGIVRFVRDVLMMIILIEAVMFLFMSGYFYFSGLFSFSESLFQALFLTISFFTNAGFDISPEGSSLTMFANHYPLLIMGMTLMFLGSVGFWVLAEFKEFVMAKLKKESFTFSPFVKTLFFLHLGIWLISAILFFSIEYNGFLSDKSFVESIHYTLFMSLTPRNAGFSTMNVTEFSQPTQLIIIFLMFIGASPNSAGGGVRTTTFLLVILLMVAYAKGRERIIYKQRFVKEETVVKAVVAIFFAMIILAFLLFILSVSEQATLFSLGFELISAFGTTGLSFGITSTLSSVGKVVLIITMFIGRVGVVALLLMFRRPTKQVSSLSYPETDMIVG